MKKYLFLFLACLLGCSASHLHAQAEQVLRPGDSINLRLTGVPAEESAAVSTVYDISDNGTINLPHIREVRASGVRPSVLQRNIEAAYRNAEIYTNPTVLISTNMEKSTVFVTVSGEVRTPNAVPISPGMSIHDAITRAGGPSEFAKMKSVKLTRDGQTQQLDLRRADSAAASTPVRPGDRIHVP